MLRARMSALIVAVRRSPGACENGGRLLTTEGDRSAGCDYEPMSRLDSSCHSSAVAESFSLNFVPWCAQK